MPEEETAIGTNRIEAFSDGVFAIVITLLVLELRVPHVENSRDFYELAAATWNLAPKFLSFLLSFAFVAIFWTSHHLFFHQVSRSSRALVWLNNLFLLTLTFIPFPTAMLGEYHENRFAVLFFGLTMVASLVSFALLRRYVLTNETLWSSKAIKAHLASEFRRSWLSAVVFAAAALTYFSTNIAISAYLLIPIFYLISQRRFRL